jgi:hypothetical protein
MNQFVNTLPYISNPIEEFGDFKFVNWESRIYPKFKGGVKDTEIEFITKLIMERGCRNIIDFGVGGGVELAAIVKKLNAMKYTYDTAEANEIDDTFITLAEKHFDDHGLSVPVHKGNWLDLPRAMPPYTHLFDFGYLTGNSLTYIGGGTREYTMKAQQSVVSKFASMIEKNGYLFIDSRNYDYIRSLMNLPKEDIVKNFSFDYSVYYHGFQKNVTVFPAYISETVVVLHYYDTQEKVWSKLDLYPIYEKDMLDILSEDFEIERIYHDFEEKSSLKSLFVQYLAKRK